MRGHPAATSCASPAASTRPLAGSSCRTADHGTQRVRVQVGVKRGGIDATARCHLQQRLGRGQEFGLGVETDRSQVEEHVGEHTIQHLRVWPRLEPQLDRGGAALQGLEDRGIGEGGVLDGLELADIPASCDGPGSRRTANIGGAAGHAGIGGRVRGHVKRLHLDAVGGGADEAAIDVGTLEHLLHQVAPLLRRDVRKVRGERQLLDCGRVGHGLCSLHGA